MPLWGYGNAESFDQANRDGIWMERNGFRCVNDPQQGDVVVIQLWVFGVPGGHIAYVNSRATYDSNGTVRFDMVGANQDYPPHSRDMRKEDGVLTSQPFHSKASKGANRLDCHSGEGRLSVATRLI